MFGSNGTSTGIFATGWVPSTTQQQVAPGTTITTAPYTATGWIPAASAIPWWVKGLGVLAVVGIGYKLLTRKK